MKPTALLLLVSGAALGWQSFDVASVKPSRARVGPDANNILRHRPGSLTGRNVTLRRLIADAYRLQLRQVLGPAWLDTEEYDVDARGAADLAPMLQSLLAERFRLVQHREKREMRVYDLVVDRAGPKLQPLAAGAEPEGIFQGDLRHLADLIAVQLSISIPADPASPGRATATPVPVLDRTGLTGVYDYHVDVRPDGSDSFTLWQRALREKLGLRLDSSKAEVEVLVVDRAERLPAAN